MQSERLRAHSRLANAGMQQVLSGVSPPHMHTPIYQQLQDRCLLDDLIHEVNGPLCDIKVSPCTDLMILHCLQVHIKLSQMCKCHWWHFKHTERQEKCFGLSALSILHRIASH